MDASGKLIVEAESKGEFKLKAEEAEKRAQEYKQ